MTHKDRLNRLEAQHAPQDNNIVIRVVWSEAEAAQFAAKYGADNIKVIEWDEIEVIDDDKNPTR